ncbi:MAG: glycoside hydrolase [Actinomycetota bacterium]|nr:glycoside hydrolase [Actinomycetota bacterium]
MARETVSRHGLVTFGPVLVAVMAALLIGVPKASADPPLTQISSDPFTNVGSQHATEVEPDTFAFGNTVVAAFQTGRVFTGGSADIGFAVSHNGGRTWPVRGFLPSLTVNATPPGPFAAASDPSVAYDAAHRKWLISSLVIGPEGVGIATSASSDDGDHWDAPVAMPSSGFTNWDKNWIACDNSTRSPFYGQCYTTWDDFGNINLLLSATSVDGGATWSPAMPTANHAIGIGGQPMVQPDGTVVVPVDDAFESTVLAYRSTDGGASWGPTVTVAPITTHFEAGGLRSSPLPSAGRDAAGNIYVVWQDCRFRPGCDANDLVLSTSSDGVSWTDPQRIPIDPVTSAVDHFIPGLGVDPDTSGGRAHLALSYYFYPDTACTPESCELDVGFVTSADGGATWSSPSRLNPSPISLAWLPSTTQGQMVGDYMSTSFVNSGPIAVFALASAPDATLHESMYAAVLKVQHGASVANERPANRLTKARTNRVIAR